MRDPRLFGFRLTKCTFLIRSFHILIHIRYIFWNCFHTFGILLSRQLNNDLLNKWDRTIHFTCFILIIYLVHCFLQVTITKPKVILLLLPITQVKFKEIGKDYPSQKSNVSKWNQNNDLKDKCIQVTNHMKCIPEHKLEIFYCCNSKIQKNQSISNKLMLNLGLGLQLSTLN